jgi:hypothetical protein
MMAKILLSMEVQQAWKVWYFPLLSELLPPFSSCIAWHPKSYHSCSTLINSYDSQLKTRENLRIIFQISKK